MLGSGVKSNSIPPATYLHRSTNAKQLLSMVPNRSSLPPSSRVLIKNISQKCSRDNRKMTLGGSPWTWNGAQQWRWTMHGTKGSRYTPPAAVQRTTASRTNDISMVLIWQSSFESLTRRRSGALQKALECYIRRRRRQCLGVVSNQTPYLLQHTCTAQPPQNNCCRWCTIDHDPRLLKKYSSEFLLFFFFIFREK